MPYPGDAPRWHAVSRWGGAVLFGALITVFHSCHGLSLFFAALCAAAGILLVLAIVDAKTALLPDALTLPLLWLGLAAAWLGGPVSLHAAVAGAMSGYLFLWLLSWVFRLVRRCDGMGYGDFKLFAALGAWVGADPLPSVLLVACLSGIVFACMRRSEEHTSELQSLMRISYAVF